MVEYNNKNEKIVNETGGISFNCPNCSNERISRTKNQRQKAVKYTCSKCNFVGP